MGWSLRRGTGTCGSCGAALVRGATWCGTCGARAVPPAAAPEQAADDVVLDASGQASAPTSGVRGRRAAVGLLAGLLVVALAAAALRSQPPVAVLGRTDAGTGMTSTGPPPTELRLSWSHQLPDEGWWSDPGQLLVGDRRVQIAGRVVDLDTGDVVRTPWFGDATGGRSAVRLSGPELVTVDRLTGAVLARVELAPGLLDRPLWPAVRGADVTMLSGDEGVLFVHDDGTIIAELPGWHETWERRRHGDEPAAVALRELLDPHRGPMGDLRLVSMRDGSTLLERDVAAGDEVETSVRGDRAVFAWRRSPDAATEDGPPGWDVDVVDATTGDVLLRRGFATEEAPWLIGRSPAGGTLLGVAVEQDLEIWEVAANDDEAVLRTAVGRSFSSPWDDGVGAGTGGTIGVTDSGLVVRLPTPDEVEARTLDGELVWQADTGGAVGLLVAGDVVALLPPPGPDGVAGSGSVIRLLDSTDGAVLTTVDPSPALEAQLWGPRPAAVVDGAVAIARTGRWPADRATELSGARWLDLTSGEVRATADVLSPWTDGEDALAAGGALWLHGMVPDPATGTPTPAMVAHAGDGTLQLLRDGELVDVAPPGLAAMSPDEGYLQPIGATGDLLAVWSETWDDTGGVWATHVIDRTTGSSLDLPGIVGRLLVDDLLVGVAQDPGSWSGVAPLVGVDPVSGEPRWTGPPVSLRDGTPLHDGELLVVGDTLRRVAVALDDGRTAWSYMADEELLDGGVLLPTHVLLATTTGVVVALDRVTGAELWRRDVGAPITSLTGAGDSALAATMDRELVVLDATGEPVRRHPLGDVALHAAALGETVVVVFQRDNEVVGLRADGAGFTTEDEVDLP